MGMWATYSELHALGTGSSELSADHDLTTFSTALHNESQHPVACSAHSETVQQLVPQGFALGDGRETTVLDFGGVEGDTVLGEFETFLNERSEFADPSTLLAEDFLGVGGTDD